MVGKLLLALLERIGQLFPQKRCTDKNHTAISFLKLSDERRRIRHCKDGANHIPQPVQFFPRNIDRLFLSRPHEQEAILERRSRFTQRHAAHIEQPPDCAAHLAPAVRILGKRQSLAPLAARDGESGEEEECFRLLGRLFRKRSQGFLIALPEIAALQSIAQDAHTALPFAALLKASCLHLAFHHILPPAKALKP